MTGDPGPRGDGLAMAVTAAEQACLAGRQRGRLATVAPDGTRQNKPAGVPSQRRARRGRHLRLREGIAGGPSGVRFPETGGRAEAASLPLSPGEHISTSFIRIHPRRIVACSIRPGWPGLHARDMPAEEAGQ
jgi:pyridoxamine 5'-phosphate oxidase family protein